MNERLAASWRASVWIALAVVSGVAATGYLIDAFWPALALLGAVACGIGIWELVRFRRWAERPLARPEQQTTLWREPVENVFRSLRRARQRQRGVLALLRRARAITEALPDAAVIINAHGVIEDFNPAARQLLRLKPSDIGRNVAALVRSPEFIGMLRANASFDASSHASEHGGDGHPIAEFASPFAEGVRLEARRIAIDAGAGRDNAGALLLVRDVTQLNRLLSMRQDFVANVSHELRTPLTVVIGYLEMLGEHGLSDEERDELVERLRRPTKRMEALVDDLLLLTRLESSPRLSDGDLDPIDMAALVRQLVDELPADVADRVLADIDGELHLYGVATEIHSACMNLVTNAVRYSPDGGAIEVSWQRHPDGAEFAVSDHGIGIAAEHLARLTERFYRVDLARSRVRGGTGLGLAIVKHVLKRHDARLEIRSELGQGSRFACVFPARFVGGGQTGAAQAAERARGMAAS